MIGKTFWSCGHERGRAHLQLSVDSEMPHMGKTCVLLPNCSVYMLLRSQQTQRWQSMCMNMYEW